MSGPVQNDSPSIEGLYLKSLIATINAQPKLISLLNGITGADCAHMMSPSEIVWVLDHSEVTTSLKLAWLGESFNYLLFNDALQESKWWRSLYSGMSRIPHANLSRLLAEILKNSEVSREKMTEWITKNPTILVTAAEKMKRDPNNPLAHQFNDVLFNPEVANELKAQWILKYPAILLEIAEGEFEGHCHYTKLANQLTEILLDLDRAMPAGGHIIPVQIIEFAAIRALQGHDTKLAKAIAKRLLENPSMGDDLDLHTLFNVYIYAALAAAYEHDIKLCKALETSLKSLKFSDSPDTMIFFILLTHVALKGYGNMLSEFIKTRRRPFPEWWDPDMEADCFSRVTRPYPVIGPMHPKLKETVQALKSWLTRNDNLGEEQQDGYRQDFLKLVNIYQDSPSADLKSFLLTILSRTENETEHRRSLRLHLDLVYAKKTGRRLEGGSAPLVHLALLSALPELKALPPVGLKTVLRGLGVTREIVDALTNYGSVATNP